MIGGYCDERGSDEYNLVLGQNRAQAAKTALVTAGVAADRIRVISYGKEKPFCTESNEECWQLNRRDGFRSTGKNSYSACGSVSDKDKLWLPGTRSDHLTYNKSERQSPSWFGLPYLV